MSKFQDLINSDQPVLIDFFATWCGPCQTLAPIIKDVKKNFGDDLKVLKVDIDKNQSLASKLQIKGVPTMILYQNGKQVWRQSGVVPASQLEAIIRDKTK
ncbi:thioredoxin [Crocinitomix catalasitica]|uniref:thioredoxin n=1 Tax=Crocinitomix catalasitica TaxID=184607 RepID=UPI000484E9F2|nr:thioredoxin [Crocinitomix catalasitica]